MLETSQANALVYSTLCGFMLVGLYAGFKVRNTTDFLSGLRTQSVLPPSSHRCIQRTRTDARREAGRPLAIGDPGLAATFCPNTTGTYPSRSPFLDHLGSSPPVLLSPLGSTPFLLI
ncbi:hypothetical protein PaG_03678 [Moesziomyces aphidis]|uniref:Uncharacterized protein n=1 Tax=Moesziomyces aphidis TaxID=84754 RepID=W3VKC4_MOEAP|nr:hypothetical protein PaG_03678 [Moesziomyces aphidis]